MCTNPVHFIFCSSTNFFHFFLQGREEGAQIDPWEDPAFEVYHVTDRYGFIQ